MEPLENLEPDSTERYAKPNGMYLSIVYGELCSTRWVKHRQYLRNIHSTRTIRAEVDVWSRNSDGQRFFSETKVFSVPPKSDVAIGCPVVDVTGQEWEYEIGKNTNWEN